MWLTDLYAAVQWPGLKSGYEPGWETRGRSEMRGVSTVVVHHTAGGSDAGDLRVCKYGRPGLPGPLCNIVLHRDGSVRVIAAGRGNHAGSVWEPGQGNYYSIGIEAVHDGVSGWSDTQYQAYVKVCAALAEHYDLQTADVLGHKEVARPKGRKADPNFDMGKFRYDVAKERKKALSAGERLVVKGSRGNDVKALQAALGADTDGIFGPQTENAVRAWQKSNGLRADGMVGKKTWGAIMRNDETDKEPTAPLPPMPPEEPEPEPNDDPIKAALRAVLDEPIQRHGDRAKQAFGDPSVTSHKAVVAWRDEAILKLSEGIEENHKALQAIHLQLDVLINALKQGNKVNRITPTPGE